MKKFEYKTIVVPCKKMDDSVTATFGNLDETELLSVLKRHGEEGWELVQILPCPRKKSGLPTFFLFVTVHIDARLVFKREIVQ